MAPASGDIFSVAVSTANPGNSGRPLDGMHCQRAGEEAGDSVICVRLLMREDVCAGSGAVNRGGRGVSAEYRYAQSQRRSFRRGGRVERRPQRGRFPPDPARHGIRDARFHGHRHRGLPRNPRPLRLRCVSSGLFFGEHDESFKFEDQAQDPAWYLSPLALVLILGGVRVRRLRPWKVGQNLYVRIKHHT